MTATHAALGAVMALFSVGCASMGEGNATLERRVRTLEDQVYRLQREREELAGRIAELEAGDTADRGERAASDARPQSQARSAAPVTSARAPVRAVAGNPEPTSGPVAPATTAPPAGPEAAFEQAQDLHRQAKFHEARDRFRDFLKRYPGHQRAEDARFLIAEASYALGEFSPAIADYRSVVESWPQGRRAPEALHKAALSYYEMEDEARALRELEELERRYPRSEAAVAARPLLEKLRKRKPKL